MDGRQTDQADRKEDGISLCPKDQQCLKKNGILVLQLGPGQFQNMSYFTAEVLKGSSIAALCSKNCISVRHFLCENARAA